MEFKDTATVTIEKGNKKKVKCYKFKYKPIQRELMVHEDIDTKDCTSISDVITGYRLLKINMKVTLVKPDDIKNRLKEFVKHYTKEGIKAEFERIEKLLNLEK
jgi:allophanate hydrolase subunit 1